MNFDRRQTPFSRFGTYLSIFQPKGDPGCGEGLYLRTHHAARVGKRDVMRLELLADGPVTVTATPTVLTLAAGDRQVRLCLTADDTVRVAGNAGLRLRVIAGIGSVAQPMTARRWSVNARQSYCRFMVDVLAGELRADCPWEPKGAPPMTLDLLPGNDGVLDAAIDRYGSTWTERDRPAFAQCVAEAAREWRRGWRCSRRRRGRCARRGSWRRM